MVAVRRRPRAEPVGPERGGGRGEQGEETIRGAGEAGAEEDRGAREIGDATCKIEGCEDAALLSGLCFGHGGGFRRCMFEDCGRGALGLTGVFCSAHSHCELPQHEAKDEFRETHKRDPAPTAPRKNKRQREEKATSLPCGREGCARSPESSDRNFCETHTCSANGCTLEKANKQRFCKRHRRLRERKVLI